MAWTADELDPDWPFDLLRTDFALGSGKTALLVVDAQTSAMKLPADGDLARRYPVLARYFNERIERVVVPNLRRLIELFRQRRWKIVYTRNGHLTATGSELTRRLRRRAVEFSHPRKTPGLEIDSRLVPTDDDLVVDKLTSGAFTATLLDHALRNMGVTGVVVTGAMTDMCVHGTARTAAELGYDSLICEDACATLTERAHNEGLLTHARIFGRVASAEDVIAELTVE